TRRQWLADEVQGAGCLRLVRGPTEPRSEGVPGAAAGAESGGVWAEDHELRDAEGRAGRLATPYPRCYTLPVLDHPRLSTARLAAASQPGSRATRPPQGGRFFFGRESSW